MKIPGVRVNRDEFLCKELMPLCQAEAVQRAIDGSTKPMDIIGKSGVERLADGVIQYHLRMATGASAIAGIPGGLAMIGTVPADAVQFYGHLLTVTQKLMYLYGYPDMGSQLTDDAKSVLTLGIGAALGEQAASNMVKKLTEEMAKQMVKRLPRAPLTKFAVYSVAKQVGKWIGVSITKGSTAKAVSKVIPVIGGLISGGLTYATFKPMAKRLQKSLASAQS